MDQVLNTRFCLARGTRDYWNTKPEFVPLLGEAIVYLDYKSIEDVEGNRIDFPGLKIGDGKTLLSDLQFSEDWSVLMLEKHIEESKTFIYSQNVASTIWTIEHNLDNYPSVTVVDSGGTTVEGEITYLNRNKIRITFSSPFSGTAYLN